MTISGKKVQYIDIPPTAQGQVNPINKHILPLNCSTSFVFNGNYFQFLKGAVSTSMRLYMRCGVDSPIAPINADNTRYLTQSGLGEMIKFLQSIYDSGELNE